MHALTLDDHLARATVVDLCHACQAIWFDAHESPRLTPGSTLTLFRTIGEHVTPVRRGDGDTAVCPRCRARLLRTHDRQRVTRFEYLRCPNGHGRLTSFFDFLREKNFITPLTPQQVEALRQHVQSVNCSNCGAPVSVKFDAACGHCGSPLSMLDLDQAATLVAQLRRAADRDAGSGAAAGPDRGTRAVDPALPLELARARREVERAFEGIASDERYFQDVSASGLVGAGLGALARWLSRKA
jgi:hypothetical protein